jgi:hypothetical protein
MRLSLLASIAAALLLCSCAVGPAISKSTTGNLEVNVSAPQDISVRSARIYVDGAFVGNISETRPVLFLRRGARTMRIELPGTKPYEQSITILGDPNPQVLNVTLEKL